MQKIQNTKTLISIVGPTAIGKTNLAIEVAKHFQSEIISCDSRQFFKEMKIGTAVPSEEELAEVKHHFIQNISIHEKYSVGDFERDGLTFLDNYFKTNDICVMVGGSGLYEKAITVGFDEFPDVDPKIREDLNNELAEFGIEKLQKELQEVDPKYFEEVDIFNKQRVTRALEIFRASGLPFSHFRNQDLNKRPFNIIKIGLELPREEMYDRINRRVDIMMNEGLLNEAKNLFSLKDLNALQTVGYRELFDFFEEKITLDFAIEEIKKNTRRFAKRQMTWFKKDETVNWFSPFDQENIINFISNKI
ncbi:tRNA (adenosine(37)-N6)-dimethylallyltransferase MiaA [Empedobacter falsenii]|uniref:tRNA (adenosine(37)-N6)-dimethylallyltransferase MiaA n=1 Tax=Empedobacter falsenii TaxID=343874 RepID=UPI00257903C4|nr:tRNA (adenosine(37)-N6)-dimethylallyltransferase MiaA [Empedobacter falsenii]MDM1297246.1 tRNA (adenosine(37)-N6)-dimethylallyltransferase MiaA [Empedobacter falsenii]MDM1317039.1 tRNA (adenosine(37)-N6)-dimethylallyltransferase MiaA [Empedobacter falsenii]